MIEALETLIVVAGALVRSDGKVLLQQCPASSDHAGLWEFPGGKVETGERIEDALARELREELGIEINHVSTSPLSFATRTSAKRQIILLLFLCERWHGDPRPLHADALEWVWPADMPEMAMPTADQEMVAALAVALK